MIGPGKKEIDVVIQDSTSPFFQYFLMNELKTDIAFTAPVAIGDEDVNVSAGHGFTGASGEHIAIFEDNRYLQLAVKNVAADVVTLAEPSTIAFSIAASSVLRGNILMNVDGSAADVDFTLQLRRFTIPVDISLAIMTMQHGANVPDDGKFGGLAALTNGVYYQKIDGDIFSLGNYIENQDFRNMGGSVTYTDKAPAGTNATNISVNMKEAFGQVMRLDPNTNDVLKGVVRDNLSPAEGMAKFTTALIGSYTVGE